MEAEELEKAILFRHWVLEEKEGDGVGIAKLGDDVACMTGQSIVQVGRTMSAMLHRRQLSQGEGRLYVAQQFKLAV